MNNITDLNIDNEILPFFNFTLNKYSKQKISEILKGPLTTVEQAINRQYILKGLSKNDHVLKDYSYTALYFNEVYLFLNNEHIDDLSQKKLKYKLTASKKEKAANISRFNQLILFFNRLLFNYFSRLDLKYFPEEFKFLISRIIKFLSAFELYKYESLVKEHKLKDQHVITLTQIISELKSKKAMKTFWEDFFLFEAYLSINQGIVKYGFVFPSLTQKELNLIDFYHPLLSNPVKNDFKSSSNVIVLNGPNMSGKSTFLKAFGLCVYLGNLGLGVPAKLADIPFFDFYSIVINRRDDIQNGYSHFMTEVLNLKEVVGQASDGKKVFAIFDELFSGTNIEDAFEISKTTINGLSKFRNSFFIISTHIQELKTATNKDVSHVYMDCELHKDAPTFTYKVRQGWSDIKIGRILFDREGLNKMLK